MNKQEEIEKRVFEAFCDASELSINKDSIKNMKPRKPDILCEVDKIGLIAFELTEIIDRNCANNLKKQIATQNFLYDYYSNLPEDFKNQFKEKYKNARIWPKFHDSCTKRQRKSILPKIFEYLLSVNQNNLKLSF